ncbi:hypothetical protein NHX12_027701, partial [Muraenolepis orangiensis]
PLSAKTLFQGVASGASWRSVVRRVAFRPRVNLGVNPVKLDSEGKTALHVAATCGLTDCLSVILAHGAELTVTDAAGLTALHLATKNHHTECVKRLVQGKCPVEAVDGSGRTALHYAAASGNLQTVELLCKHRSPVNLRDAEGFSPLLLSSQHGHSEGLDVHHYVQLCSSAEVKGSLTAALHSPRGPETRSPTSPKHDQEERSQLLETIKDLRNITEEDQEKQRPLFLGKEDLKESTIMTSSASFHDPSSIMTELLETREENRWLRSQEPSRGEREDEEEDEEARERKEEARKRERSREEDLLLKQEVQQLKFRLAQSGCEQERAAQRTAQEEEQDRRSAQMEKWYKEAQEEIRMLQDALRGTVTVEEAARDFKDMKAELGGAIGDLQRRLLELSRQQQTLTSRVLELQAALEDSEKQLSSSQQEAVLLRREAEVQAQTSVSEDDHTRVVSSLGNAIKELEGQAEGLREELSQNKTQVDALQSRITADKELASDGSVSRLHHEATRLSLEEEVGRLTQLLQGALRKQDEMALEAAAVRESRAEREALRELAVSREAEVRSLGGKLVEARDGVSQLKQLVETHQTSEREKNKRIDDLSREVGKLKEALNSLSQLPHGASPASKRLQQSQQLMETMQQQNKQLQYQLAEINKQHSEVVSVYRTHLLYAVQGQMDEDVQKALKQILMMCKMPNTTKEAF